MLVHRADIAALQKFMPAKKDREFQKVWDGSQPLPRQENTLASMALLQCLGFHYSTIWFVFVFQATFFLFDHKIETSSMCPVRPYELPCQDQ